MFLKSRDNIIYSNWLKIYWPNNASCTLSKYNKKTNSHRASASFYFALVNLTKACKIPLVKYQMAWSFHTA